MHSYPSHHMAHNPIPHVQPRHQLPPSSGSPHPSVFNAQPFQQQDMQTQSGAPRSWQPPPDARPHPVADSVRKQSMTHPSHARLTPLNLPQQSRVPPRRKVVIKTPAGKVLNFARPTITITASPTSSSRSLAESRDEREEAMAGREKQYGNSHEEQRAREGGRRATTARGGARKEEEEKEKESENKRIREAQEELRETVRKAQKAHEMQEREKQRLKAEHRQLEAAECEQPFTWAEELGVPSSDRYLIHMGQAHPLPSSQTPKDVPTDQHPPSHPHGHSTAGNIDSSPSTLPPHGNVMQSKTFMPFVRGSVTIKTTDGRLVSFLKPADTGAASHVPGSPETMMGGFARTLGEGSIGVGMTPEDDKEEELANKKKHRETVKREFMEQRKRKKEEKERQKLEEKLRDAELKLEEKLREAELKLEEQVSKPSYLEGVRLNTLSPSHPDGESSPHHEFLGQVGSIVLEQLEFLPPPYAIPFKPTDRRRHTIAHSAFSDHHQPDLTSSTQAQNLRLQSPALPNAFDPTRPSIISQGAHGEYCVTVLPQRLEPATQGSSVIFGSLNSISEPISSPHTSTLPIKPEGVKALRSAPVKRGKVKGKAEFARPRKSRGRPLFEPPLPRPLGPLPLSKADVRKLFQGSTSLSPPSQAPPNTISLANLSLQQQPVPPLPLHNHQQVFTLPSPLTTGPPLHWTVNGWRK